MKRLMIILFLLAVCRSSDAVEPERKYSLTPETLKLNYKDLTLTTSDHYKLKAWELQPAEKTDKKITIVIACNGEGNMSDWLYRGGALSKAGYRVLLFDYRGFGESQDFPMQREQLYYNEFELDLKAAITHAKKNKKNKLTGVLAISSGSVTAIRAVQSEPVDFLVFDGAVLDPVLLQKRYFATESRKITLPQDDSSVSLHYEKLNIPLLIFAGLKDSLTTVADARQIIAQNPVKRQIQVYDGDHLQSYDVLTGQVSGDRYIARITSFLAPMNAAGEKKN
ncbi:alpha/beta hydrolase [Pararcticibacter amylolyticus]|uniref:Serine aminopeptidase S33 domain-containing protein n=1 Tax=Pararcticibacter amylolyticus TaxID=2173175 RepID=A0A2U2PEW2_9SPHI|nr:alpha/beta fold hydrolase [Pararcticibacter amylolyticus]PWG79926.1 hypothetical protein DDR33_14085 [Pararcticibacter amylolyticus]